MTSDEHIREQAEAAVIHACEVLDAVSDTHIVFMRLPNGEYARKISGPTYELTVRQMADVCAHMGELLSTLAELTAARIDKEKGFD